MLKNVFCSIIPYGKKLKNYKSLLALFQLTVYYIRVAERCVRNGYVQNRLSE